MSTVTGRFVVHLDGEFKTFTFSSLPYPQFWGAQFKVVQVLQETLGWGFDQMNGVVPEFTGPPTGNVSFSFDVSFDGTASNSGCSPFFWNGIPQDAAQYIADRLSSAFAGVSGVSVS
jgi:hypothetical protein